MMGSMELHYTKKNKKKKQQQQQNKQTNKVTADSKMGIAMEEKAE